MEVQRATTCSVVTSNFSSHTDLCRLFKGLYYQKMFTGSFCDTATL